ncbi:MAG: hypothetical protein AAGA28_19215 [Pseudomonadota bacterium]
MARSAAKSNDARAIEKDVAKAFRSYMIGPNPPFNKFDVAALQLLES